MKASERHSSPPPSRSSDYAEAVPAVLRALDVIEYLEKSSASCSLSEMSRAVRISPSSLLAILRTLASRGYVDRDDATARYRLGPAHGSLATKSTARLAIREAADGVVALARAAVTEPDVEASGRRQRDALLALGLAGRHLSDFLLGEATRELHVGASPEPVWRSEASGPLTSAELDRFLNGGLIATLSCVQENGYPYSVPVWYHWEDGRFWVVPRARAEWARYLDQNPRVSLAISEHHSPLRRVLVEGKAEPVFGQRGEDRVGQLTALMARRYLGPSAAPYLEATMLQVRRVFAIVPEKLVTWHGLAPHPRYQTPPSPVIDNTGVA